MKTMKTTNHERDEVFPMPKGSLKSLDRRFGCSSSRSSFRTVSVVVFLLLTSACLLDSANALLHHGEEAAPSTTNRNPSLMAETMNDEIAPQDESSKIQQDISSMIAPDRDDYTRGDNSKHEGIKRSSLLRKEQEETEVTQAEKQGYYYEINEEHHGFQGGDETKKAARTINSVSRARQDDSSEEENLLPATNNDSKNNKDEESQLMRPMRPGSVARDENLIGGIPAANQFPHFSLSFPKTLAQPPSKRIHPSSSSSPSTMDSNFIAPFQRRRMTTLYYAQLGADLDGEFEGDESGSAVALSFYGDTVAIGARYNDGGGTLSGHVRVFFWDGLVWSQKGQDLDGASSADYLGSSVALSADGDIVASGAPGNDGGHVRVWKWVDGLWSQLGDDILGESVGDQSGFAISLSSDGTVLAVGARLNDDNGIFSGHVKVWEWTGESWTQRGQTLVGELSYDSSGWSVSMSSDGSLVAIGAPYNDGNGSASGHVRVWEWSGSAWTQRGLDIDGQSSGDSFGWSVSMSGDGSMVAVGSPESNQTGYVHVWEWDGSVWSQKGADLLGNTVALSWDGSSVAIGAPYNDDGSGHVKVFEWSGSSWESRGDAILGEAIYDDSGASISLSWNGGRLAVGAPLNDGNGGSRSGHVRVFQWTGVLPEAPSQAPSQAPSKTVQPSGLPIDNSGNMGDDDDDNDGFLIIIIICVVVGAVVAGVMAFIFWRRSKKGKTPSPSPEKPMENPSADAPAQVALSASFDKTMKTTAPQGTNNEMSLTMMMQGELPPGMSESDLNGLHVATSALQNESSYREYCPEDVAEEWLKNQNGLESITVMAPPGALKLTMDKRGLNGGHLVAAVKSGSPLSGKVEVGDELIKLNSIDLTNMDGSQAKDALRQSAGVARHLTLLRSTQV